MLQGQLNKGNHFLSKNKKDELKPEIIWGYCNLTKQVPNEMNNHQSVWRNRLQWSMGVFAVNIIPQDYQTHFLISIYSYFHPAWLQENENSFWLSHYTSLKTVSEHLQKKGEKKDKSDIHWLIFTWLQTDACSGATYCFLSSGRICSQKCNIQIHSQ